MVKVDREDLANALDAGFREDTAEKVFRLLGILRELESRTASKGKFTLKGGTALNIFHLPHVPRLSVDIDLIATGFPGANAGTKDREQAISTIEQTLKALDYKINKADSEASGCTLHCSYRNALGSNDQIKIDLDFIGRQTLLEPEQKRGPRLFNADDLSYALVATPELLAQKLVAVAYRGHPRDLYDMDRMLREGWHGRPKARNMYLAQSFLKDHEWYRLAYPTLLNVPYKPDLLRDVLREREEPPALDDLRQRATEALVPKFTEATAEDKENQAALLKGDLAAFARIAGETNPSRVKELASNPALLWRLQQPSRRS
ncbi:MAG: nucleotidyl transferase AbiEii/AbiGii toxin family protein [Halobacteriales archaeon]|nr:nucleotidyl transferase AbiEii/AbiGii toxin family protein [Halobacteriales archaeon]